MQVRSIYPVLLSLMLGTVPTTMSHEARASDAESVDDLMKRGIQLRLKNKPAEALELFERAHAVAPSARTLGQIGLAELALDRWVEASEHIAGALAAADDPWVKRNQAALESGRDIVAKHVGELVVTGPAGVEVFTDGKRIGTLPLARPLKVAAGHLVVRAVSPYYEPFATTVDIIAGGRTPLTLALTSTPASPPTVEPAQPTPLALAALPPPALPPPPPQIESSRTWKTPAGAALGLAGVGLLTWGVVWIATDSTAIGGSSGKVLTERDTKTPGWVLAGAGAAAMIGGGLLLYSDRSDRTRMAAVVGPTGLTLAGVF